MGDPHPFYIDSGRAMVSLGPLSPKQYCTYRCGFCYVQADFRRYASLSNDQIVEYLQQHRAEFDIVYISGDTDSFSPPRTETGVSLLEDLEILQCDLLFTTRALLDAKYISRLAALAHRLQASKLNLFGCVSVTRLRSCPNLEPPPVPQPLLRIAQLKTFREAGLVSVLAMRPFLPVIPLDEYLEIIELSASGSNIALGEAWFVDPSGIIERRVLQGEYPVDFEMREMDFNIGGGTWKVWESSTLIEAVTAHCKKNVLPFFMRSRPAIEYVRADRANLTI